MSRIVVPPRHARLIADATMLSVHDKLPTRVTTATTLTSWARAIRKALDAAGVDSAALFAEAGLDITALALPQARYPVARTNRLWQLAVDATGDPAFALTVARQSGMLSFHALGYSLSASATLREAFERLLRYFRVVSDGAELRFHCEGAQCIYEIAPTADGHAPIPEAVDASRSSSCACAVVCMPAITRRSKCDCAARSQPIQDPGCVRSKRQSYLMLIATNCSSTRPPSTCRWKPRTRNWLGRTTKWRRAIWPASANR